MRTIISTNYPGRLRLCWQHHGHLRHAVSGLRRSRFEHRPFQYVARNALKKYLTAQVTILGIANSKEPGQRPRK